jgi:ADP-ribosylglycohydrolase
MFLRNLTLSLHGCVRGAVGVGVGDLVSDVVNKPVGDVVGGPVGDFVGEPVSNFVGETVGDFVREPVGDLVGALVGEPVVVGDVVGDPVGDCVGEPVSDLVFVLKTQFSTFLEPLPVSESARASNGTTRYTTFIVRGAVSA